MKNESVRTFVRKTEDTKEQVTEFDVVLPDYYPEVNRILKCSVVPATESVSFAGDKLGVSGNAQATVVFADSDGAVHVFETSQKYTKIIRCESLADGDKCFVSQDVTQVNYRATGPRRIEIRSSFAVGVSVCSVCDTDFISDFDDEYVEQCCEQFDCYEIRSAERFLFEISGAVDLPDGVNSESEQLSASGEVFIRETKVIKNKVMLKGNCAAEIIAANSDGSVKKFNADVPFTEIHELYGADENEECHVTASLKNAHIALKAANGGNSAVFSAEMETVVFTVSKATKTAVCDAFSVKNNLDANRVYADVITDIVAADTTSTVSLDVDTYDFAPTEILAAFADGIRYGCTVSDGAGRLNGTCTLNAIVKNSAGTVAVVSRTAAFDCELPYAGNYFVSVTASRIKAEPVSNDKVGFSAVFAVKGFGLRAEKRELIESCRAAECVSVGHSGGIAVYYAHAGEKLWDIAKENRCRISTLKEINGMETDITTENRAMIFPVGF